MTSLPDSAWDDDARAERESLELSEPPGELPPTCDELGRHHEWVIVTLCRVCLESGSVEWPE